MQFKKIFVLDFDGVICDSIDECMITSYNAYYNKNLFDLAKIPQDFKIFFYNHRYLVRPAKEYFILCETFEKKIEIKQEKFDEMKNKFLYQIDLFEKSFFRARRKIQQNIDLWVSYHRLYPESEKFLSQLSSKFFILTNKDNQSVKILSKYFNFDKKIISIFSKEISNDKNTLFNYFFQNFEIKQNEKIIFVDDNEDHLLKVKGHPIELYFANWGYSKKQRFNKFIEISSLLELK